jgi:hypothetical protein
MQGGEVRISGDLDEVLSLVVDALVKNASGTMDACS